MLEVTGKGHAQHLPGTISASTATAAQQVAFNHQRTHWVRDPLPCNALKLTCHTGRIILQKRGLEPSSQMSVQFSKNDATEKDLHTFRMLCPSMEH